jgi:2,3-bisphosphoglycerate-dependent phosphoglycerate mutase
MVTHIIFETHAWSEDNDQGLASGWRDSRLSARGRAQAAELGVRRRGDGLQAVFASDLGRAVETVRIAFAETSIPILCDWRLRECDYGACNGRPVADIHGDRRCYLDAPYPGGESWRQAIHRIGRVLPDLRLRWEGARILVIGHRATHLAFDHLLNGVALEELILAEFTWRTGWEYQLP